MVVDAIRLATQDQTQLFFRNPAEPPITPGTFGTLYLLRRDLNDMRRLAPDAALWPRAMVIFAGIDLLGKFLANSDDRNIGRRFRTFVSRFVTEDHTADSPDNQAIWQCRNSVLHSFGWFATTSSQTYRFTIMQEQTRWIIQQDSTNSELWYLNLTDLERRFEESITKYRDEIASGALSFPTGNNIFERYGWTNIG